MAKRFTDTGLSRKKWFRELSPTFKAAWRTLLDECDSAGVWSIDMDGLSFLIGEDLFLSELLRAVNSDKVRAVQIAADQLLLVGFIEFQYGKLSEDCKPHKPVIARLVKLGLWEEYLLGFETLCEAYRKGMDTLSERYQKGIHTLQEKEKEKDKEKEGGPGETKSDRNPEPEPINSARTFETRFKFDLQSLFALYPRQQKKSLAIDALAKKIRTQSDYDDWMRAIRNYAEYCRKENIELKFMLTFPSFVEEWTDWRDWSHKNAPLAGAKGSIRYEEATQVIARQEADRGPLPEDRAEAAARVREMMAKAGKFGIKREGA